MSKEFAAIHLKSARVSKKSIKTNKETFPFVTENL
jgi:hypothetical protein